MPHPPLSLGSCATTPPILAVVGPTGVGKSELGVQLAAALDGEIINADSMQLYRGMDIGTAKLSRAQRRGIPHHLLDTLEVTEEASVADFQRQARSIIAAIEARGRLPILVGGSGLYVRAVLDVITFPPTDPEVRGRWLTRLHNQGEGELLNRLREVDPLSAGRLSDPRRIVRALEVHELTGRPFSSWMPQRQYYRPAVQLGLWCPPESLSSTLASRVDTMVEAGLEEEVEALARRGLRRGKTASRALGYRQYLAALDDTQYTREQARQDTVTATVQFARRQRRWFQADPRICWFDITEVDSQDRAFSFARNATGQPSSESAGDSHLR